jgi:predicted  nucleic acid-binding Zn-ribbon protein
MSSPLRPGASLEEELQYYKSQYAQLETDLADFQSSSKDLEEQLERDIEAAEKNERRLREQVEKLGYEVAEWKEKHAQSKREANAAQAVLEKEVTGLREEGRRLGGRLRDIEVANDDYERQARNTESSLEDLESKYNVAIERSVMQEEEIRQGEKEREGLRIECQRLRDELGDLRVESEITREKLRKSEDVVERLRSRKPSPLAVESLRVRSPLGSEASGITPSSPTASTPPPKSDSMSDAPTPPSPPLSDVPATKQEPKTPAPQKRRSLLPDAAATPRPSLYGSRGVPKHSRGPSMASTTSASDAKAVPTASTSMRPPAARPGKRVSTAMPNEGLPRSDSLYQIKALRGRMQKIEQRVQSAKSRLPAPGTRTPTQSPRPGSSLGEQLPASVTMRRSMKRPSAAGSVASSTANETATGGSGDPEKIDEEPAPKTERRRESHIKRLSYGIPRPTSSAAGDRPPSVLERERPPSAAASSRPTSRASLAGNTMRPGSRAGARTAATGLGTDRANGHGATRPRSSIGGAYATIHGTPRSHRPSASVSELRRLANESEDGISSPSTARRTTLDRSSVLPAPGFAAVGGRRESIGAIPTLAAGKGLRRTSTGLNGGRGGDGDGEMRPPAAGMRPPSRRKMSDVGETY